MCYLLSGSGAPPREDAVTVMSDVALRSALESGGIVIEPAPEDIKPASIDFRLGPEAFLATDDEIINLEAKLLLVIPPGGMVIVSVLEQIVMGARYAGHIGLRSVHARKGLALLAGPQIDPGFKGRLHVAFVNLSPVEITIAHREPVITIVFHDLGGDVERPYGSDKGDEYHEQDKITGAEIDVIRQRRGYAMSEVIRDMASISRNVGELKTAVDGYIQTTDRLMRRADTYLRIFVGTLVALALAAIGTGIGVIITLAS